MVKKKIFHTYLGRFSPFHKGHQLIVEKLIRDYGIENCLVLIGSINTRNSRTPYTYEQREQMIGTLFPGIKVVGLPDGKPGQLYFDGTTNEAWLDSIEKLENSMGAKFIFYGGCEEDLEILGQRFETSVAVDRHEVLKISATEIRQALDANDNDTLINYLDSRVVPYAVSYYQEFLNTK